MNAMPRKKSDTHADTPGARIAAARIKAGLSLPGLADRIGTTEGAIRQLEAAGEENYPKLPNALKIAAILGMDPWEMAFGAEASLERKRLGAAESADALALAGPHLPKALEQWMKRAEEQLEANRLLLKALEKKVTALERPSRANDGGKRNTR